MGIFDGIRRSVARVTGAAEEDLNRLERTLQFQVRLWRFCALRLKETNAMAMSAALSFRTIFAMVPILVLVFLILKSVGVVDNSKKMLHEFLDQSGLTTIEYTRPGRGPSREGTAATPTAAVTPTSPGGPVVSATSGAPAAITSTASVAAASTDSTAPTSTAPVRGNRTVTVAGHIERIVGDAEDKLNIGSLGPIGVVLLIWTALTLLMTMERCLNRVFEAPRHRTLARRIILYWSVITLGPLVLIAAGWASGKAFDLVSDMPSLSYLIGTISWMSSVLLGILFLSMIYTLMPNTSVPFRKAFLGATLAFPVWLVARWAFGLYVEFVVSSQSLYGALALIPLFLLWLNLSWTIFLLGAQLVFALSNRSRVIEGGRSLRQVLSHWDLLAALISVGRANRLTGRPVPSHRVAGDLALPEDRAAQLLTALTHAGLVAQVTDGNGVGGGNGRRFVLARPADTIAVASVMDFHGATAEAGRATATTWSKEIGEAVGEVRRRAGAGLQDLTLAAVMG
jgi:membrane protein